MGNVYIQIPDDDITQTTSNDVIATLAANGGTGITQAQGSSLFTKEAIKAPFSKKKPIRSAEVEPDRTTDWWKGIDGLCGLGIVGGKATSWAELANIYESTDEMNGWEYLNPRGYNSETKERYRIKDFKGYFPGAQPMSLGFSIASPLYKTKTEASAMIAHNIDDRALRWEDFDVLKHYYFGVVMYLDLSNAYAVTSQTTLGDGGSEVKVNPSVLLANKTYKAYPFISSHPMTWGGVPVDGQALYTIPKVNPVEVDIVDSAINILVTAQRVVTAAALQVTWAVQVSNTSGKAVELNNNSIEVYREAINMIGNAKATISNTTVAAGVTQTIGSGTLTLSYSNLSENDKKYMNLWAYVTLGGGVYTAKQQIPVDISVGDKE